MTETAIGDDALRAHLVGLELMLLDAAVRASPARLDALIAADFREIAASGRMFGKDEVLARLPLETGVGFRAEAMEVRAVAPGVVLLVYRAHREAGGRCAVSRRSSLWRRDAEGWRMAFHQGTPLEEGATMPLHQARPAP
ncbi:DUF4440 domain-containing protein [Luteimonas sp. SJ-92]|uniref:DUF4440 domain-containing protein n=1 Tax=Luteimonas salinisoli TaxID=2752307 RepID=A0A853JGE4_9GAMM|nr:DUF4440 domain-containing protein [Luteimonas salinisoli]NZA27518.1 DUF4440 domain-containing protein [Luteimonas salinisoli]